MGTVIDGPSRSPEGVLDHVVGGLMYVVVAAVISAVLGGLFVHVLETRKLRYERLFERRAEVISKLSEKLYTMQFVFTVVANPYKQDADPNEQIQDANRAFDDLRHYYFSNAIWLDPEDCEKVESFIEMAYITMGDYISDLNERGHPQSATGRDAALRIRAEIQPLRRELEKRFRDILYPPDWYEPLLRFLERIQSRNRQPSESVPARTDGRSGDSQRPQG